jgi:hypothetical protein
MLKLAANVNMKYAPYPSQVVSSPTWGLAEPMKDGKLRALATASLTRIERVPDVPAVAKSGYKNYEAEVAALGSDASQGDGSARPGHGISI